MGPADGTASVFLKTTKVEIFLAREIRGFGARSGREGSGHAVTVPPPRRGTTRSPTRTTLGEPSREASSPTARHQPKGLMKRSSRGGSPGAARDLPVGLGRCNVGVF